MVVCYSAETKRQMTEVTFTYKLKDLTEKKVTDICFKPLMHRDLRILEKLEYKIVEFSELKDKYIPFLQRIFKDLCEIKEYSKHILFKITNFEIFNSYSKIISFLSFPRYLEEFNHILEKIDFTKTDAEIFTELCELSVVHGNGHSIIKGRDYTRYYIDVTELDKLEFCFTIENYLNNLKTINHKSSFRYLLKQKS